MTWTSKLFASGLAVAAIAVCTAASAELTLNGLDDDQERNARALIALDSASCAAPEWRIERLFEDADLQLRDALEALGYYKVEVEKSLDLEGDDCWRARFDISVGEPVVVRNVEIDIRGDAASEINIDRVMEGRRPVIGETLNHGSYESYKKLLLSRLSGAGYFNAKYLSNQVVVDEALEYADVEIIVDSGPRYFFGEVSFEGNVLNHDLLRGYAYFEQGEPYNGRDISRLHESLNGSGFFESVSIVAEPAADGSRVVPVKVTVTPAKPRVYSIGAGYATDLGLQGRLGYTNRRRNERGHQFDARLFVSEVESELTGVYRWPRGRPTAEWVEVFGGYQQKRTDTSRSDTGTLGVRFSRNRSDNWLETPYISFEGEDFRVADQIDSTRLLMPGITWASSRGRDLTRIESGRRLSIDVRGAYEGLLSDTTFGQVRATAKWITSPTEKIRLLARVDLGFTAKDDLQDLPATVRFFTGGDNSVRGYGYETIGPVDDMGEVTGGSNLTVLSLEADYVLYDSWGIAAFVDTGSAYNGSNIDLQTGIGVGVRWYSPLGPIRVDIAHPLDDPTTDYRFHITLGTDL